MKTDAAKPTAQKGKTVAIIAMLFLFAMISFVTNLAAPIGTIWKNSYDWSGMLGNFMNFLAYAFMGVPAGLMLQKIGYKKTALTAIIIGIIGLGLQLMASYVGGSVGVFSVSGQVLTLNFIIYLLGAFICGFCVCILNVVVNPMLNLLGGGGNKGNQLVQVGGSANSLVGTLTPLCVGALVGQVTAGTSMLDVVTLLYTGIGVFVLALVVIGCVAIPEPHRSGVSKKKDTHSPLSFRHTLLGVIGIFFYVGVEVGIPAVLIFYLSDSAASGITENATATATAVAAVYWLLMLVGRMVSSVISGKVSSKAQLTVVSAIAIILIITAILMPTDLRINVPAYSVENGFTVADVPANAFMLVLCGLCTSVMWGAIFNLAVEGLGKYTAKASGIFMAMVVGGGIMPFIQERVAGACGYLNSYWLPVAMFAYLLFYALVGSRNVNSDIPVDEDEAPDLRDL